MKAHILVLAAFAISMAGLSGCKKDKIPEDPFDGLNNQLKCKINGNDWKSNERYGGLFYITSSDRKYLFLSFGNGLEEVNFFVSPPFNKSSEILNKSTLHFPITSYPENYISFEKTYSTITPPDIYITNSIDTGRIDFLVFDTINKVIKAKFFFTGKDNQTGKKITITDGYFEYHQ